ncbi:hypothetical protein GCM10010246_20120 [Streptomyces cuspidosporus]|uniref:Uncharacterized protein n=1 Tax=Streptomyces cuspidosporus TaxID=66882 RepID=A0ABN3FR94_9ACTN
MAAIGGPGTRPAAMSRRNSNPLPPAAAAAGSAGSSHVYVRDLLIARPLPL